MALAVPQPHQEGPEGRIFFGHQVSLSVFEGPLDLLLFLIKRDEIDIYDIPISHITEQYMGYLALLDSLDIEVASDFIVMAATLMEIKSRSLLPRPPLANPETPEEEDPRAELVARLLEYRRFKDAAETLDDLAEESRFILSRPYGLGEESFDESAGVILTGKTTAFHLWAAFQEVLSRAKENPVGEIIRPRFTVAIKIAELSARLKRAAEGLSFFALFPEGVTKLEVIITFLALLELIKLGRVAISQPEIFADIMLFAKAEATV